MMTGNRPVRLLVVLVAVLCAAGLTAATFKGWCVEVPEGDRITVLVQKKRLKVRLHNIDCPDRGQPYFEEARKAVMDLIYRQRVVVEIVTYDDEMIVGRVLSGDRDLSPLLVGEGLAWYNRREQSDKTLAKLQKKARKSKKGLWSQDEPVPPWHYRDLQSSRAEDVDPKQGSE